MKHLRRLKRLNVQDRHFWAGVDYLTCTTKTEKRGSLLYAAGHQLVEQEAALGNEVSRFQWKGYQGFRCGSVAIGTRPEDSMVQVSSELADATWQTLVPLSTGISRIDLQITALLDQPHPGMWRNAFKHRYERSGTQRRAESVKLIACDKSGDSCRFGSVRSNRWGRGYDKGLESDCAPAGQLQRWEMQLRNRAARFAAHALFNEHYWRACVIRQVCSFFETWGVVLPDVGDGIPWNGVEVACVDRMPQHQRQLDWLSRVCRPVCDSLVDQGHLLNVLTRLGLSNVHTPKAWFDYETDSDYVQ
jgi:hypothetical protein